MNKKEIVKDEMDCAAMLGMTVDDYRDSLKDLKAPRKSKETKTKTNYDNNFLKFLGVDETMLKKKQLYR